MHQEGHVPHGEMAGDSAQPGSCRHRGLELRGLEFLGSRVLTASGAAG